MTETKIIYPEINIGKTTPPEMIQKFISADSLWWVCNRFPVSWCSAVS